MVGARCGKLPGTCCRIKLPYRSRCAGDEKEENNLHRLKSNVNSIIWIAVLAFCCHLVFCPVAVRSQPTSKGEPVRGAIRVSGAWALYPMMVKWAEEFKKVHPGVRIDVSAGGAGKGVTDALSGLVDIGMVSRELRPEEIRQKAFYVPVVKDAVFPTINSKNDVFKELMYRGVKKKALQDLWIAGRTVTWGELAGGSDKSKIRVYTRSDSCGAAETWAGYLGAKQEDLRGVAVYGDPGVAEAVRRDKTGIGFNNLNYAYDMKTGLPCRESRCCRST